MRYAGQPANGKPGWQVELLCRRDRVLDQWAQEIAATGVRVHRIDLRRPTDYLAVFRRLRAVDLAHLVLAYPTGKYQLVTALLARLAGTPLIATHQLVVDIGDIKMSPLRRAFWRSAFRLYRRLARRNIASSQAGWKLLTGRYRFPESSTELIYNGADLSLFTPLMGSARSAVRQAIGAEVAGEAWSDDVLFSCTVARLTPQKGLLDLVEAAAEVTRQIPKVRFVLAGDGEERPRLEARVAALQLQRHVLFAGSRPLADLARWLAAADLFVLSSHYEGMPLSMIEAMAAGCPVVATAVGGIPDIVGDSKAGVIVGPRHPPALAEAITRILGDVRTRSAMATAARERAMTTFDVRTCYEKTTELYGVVSAGASRADLPVSA